MSFFTLQRNQSGDKMNLGQNEQRWKHACGVSEQRERTGVWGGPGEEKSREKETDRESEHAYTLGGVDLQHQWQRNGKTPLHVLLPYIWLNIPHSTFCFICFDKQNVNPMRKWLHPFITYCSPCCRLLWVIFHGLKGPVHTKQHNVIFCQGFRE